LEFKENMFVGHDPQLRQPDITRAKEILNWTPKVRLDEGLRFTIDYFKQLGA
jgi:dTDP-glucose 4,6-dehydratase